MRLDIGLLSELFWDMNKVLWSFRLLRLESPSFRVILLDDPRTVPSSSPFDFWFTRLRAIGTILTLDECLFVGFLLRVDFPVVVAFLFSFWAGSLDYLWAVSFSLGFVFDPPWVISNRCLILPFASIWVLLLIPDKSVGYTLFYLVILLKTKPDLPELR